MPTKTSTASGAYSVGATWVGGVAPVDGDDVIIAAGHVVTVSTQIINPRTIEVRGTLRVPIGADEVDVTTTRGVVDGGLNPQGINVISGGKIEVLESLLTLQGNALVLRTGSTFSVAADGTASLSCMTTIEAGVTFTPTGPIQIIGDVPSVNDVVEGVGFNSGQEGQYRVVAPSNVRSGVDFGPTFGFPTGSQTGTLNASGGSGSWIIGG